MKWVMFSFVSFGLFIGGLVFICVKQDINLVSKNYYQEELKYEEKIVQKKNTDALLVQPAIRVKENNLVLTFPQMKEIENGELKLIRPSNEHLDQKFQLNNTLPTEHSFVLSHTEKGLYRVSMKWTMSGKEYYYEKVLVL